MAIRIPWDEQEAAILISACVCYNNGGVTKEEAISSVSKILRQRAINQGIEIDDLFRNNNGITMQFMLMNELITGEKCGLRGASKLFISMVDMFENDKKSFNRILKGVKQVLAEKPIKDEFFNWISNKITANQLSDSYTLCNEIEKYCLEKGILQTALFETTNINMINKVSRIIITDKDFREAHKRSLSKVKGIIYYYINFIKEYVVDDLDIITENILVESGSISDKKNIDIDDTKSTEHLVEKTYKNNSENNDNLDLPIEISSIVKHNRIQFSTWLVSKGEDTGNILAFLLNLSKTGNIAEKNKIIDDNIYIIDSLTILKKIGRELQKCDEFFSLLPKVKRQYLKTLELYIEYKTIKKTTNSEDNIVANNSDVLNEWELKDFLNANNLKYCLGDGYRIWVIGGEEIRSYMFQCWRHSITFRYKKNGGSLTYGAPAWMATLTKFQYNKIADNSVCISEDLEKMCVTTESSTIEEDDKLALILKKDYENGFRIKSAIDKGRFRVFYKEHFDKELLLEDEQLLQALMKLGVLREERIYAKQGNDQEELLKQIYDEMTAVFDSGNSCVYEDSIYDRYSIKLAEQLQMYNSRELSDLLLKMSQGKLRRKNTFLCLQQGQYDLKKDVLNVVKSSPTPLKYDNIEEIMWYVPIDKVKQVMVNIKSIVYVAPETYFYAPNLPVSRAELMEIKNLIFQLLEIKSYITGVELRTAIEEKFPSVAINTADFTTYGLRNSLAYLLQDTFSFNGPVISTFGKEFGMAEIFSRYCQDREQVTAEELKKFAADMDTIIYWDAIREVTIRITDEIFLREDQVSFDIKAIDEILNELCDKDYVPLKEMGLFTHFPLLSVPWNGYVLESYLYRYSQKFKLLHAGFSASGYFGVMIRQDCNIQSYRALIVDALAHSEKWVNIPSALEFLVEEGYQQRKFYADIENVVFEAKVLNDKIRETKK